MVSIQTEAGATVDTAETDSEGFFRVALKPGKYVLTPFTYESVEGSPVIILGTEVPVVVEKKSYTDAKMPFIFGWWVIFPPGPLPPAPIPLPPVPLPQ